MKKILVPALCVFALGFAFVDAGHAATRKHHATPPKDRVAEDTARATALGKVPGGTVKSHELERENGKWVYSYDISEPGKPGVEEVIIDAKTGEFVSQKHESAAMERRERAKEHAAVKNKATSPMSSPAPSTPDTTHH